jgi:hypothetical protein
MTERRWGIEKEDIQVWGQRAWVFLDITCLEKPKYYQIHPVKNAHIF